MLDRIYIDKFIKLRAERKTYDEIVEEIGISKPTLIRWGRLYKTDISLAASALTDALVKRIVADNEKTISNISENIKRALLDKFADEKVKRRFLDQSYKRLGDIFMVKVKSIELGLDEDGNVRMIKIIVK